MRILTVTLHPAIDQIISTSHLTPNEPNLTKLIKKHAAGKGINAARVLHNLGIPVLAMTFQGGDLGKYFSESLSREGIPALLIPCQSETRTTTVVFEDESGKSHSFVEPRQAITPLEADTMYTYFLDIVGEFDLCLLCGAGEGFALELQYQRMIEAAHIKNVPCLLDSSGQSLINGLKAKPLMVKINLGELSSLAGRAISSIQEQLDALIPLLQYTEKYAAVSDQANGILMVEGNHVWHGQFNPGKVLYTLGCGDAALAGMAYAIANRKESEEILRFGVACGAANTQMFGAGYFPLSTMWDYLSQVNVQTLEKLELLGDKSINQ
jgi:tagatose 6-phosphate kinase